jgi:hypothetical protein
LLLALGAVSVLLAVPAVHALDPISITTSNGPTVCPLNLHGTWSGDTCTISGTFDTSGETVDVDAGVTVAAAGSDGIDNFGTLNNYGTVTASLTSDTGTGINNYATINNYGTMTGGGPTTIYSTLFFGTGISNGGTINNLGTLTGIGGTGISNGGTINNAGTVTGNANGCCLIDFGVDNGATINDYCGGTVSSSPSLIGNPPVSISTPCYAITFDESGILTSGITWGVTASWGPFVLHSPCISPCNRIAISAAGSITYSYDSPVAGQGSTYVCQSSFEPCSGTAAVSGDMTFSATYSPAPPTTSAPEFPLGLSLLLALTVPTLLMLKKRASLGDQP